MADLLHTTPVSELNLINFHDANGSVTNRFSNTETNLYEYNLERRLARATILRQEGGTLVAQTNQYAYNASGIRTRVETTGTASGTNVFLNDPQNLTGFSQILEELPAVDATPTVTYTIGSRVLAQEQGGTVSHLMADGHGSTRLVTGTSGTITDRYSYDAYGKGVDFVADILNPPTTKVLYTGEQYDAGLRQIYLRARYYNPAVGRFGARDTVEGMSSDPLTLHKYAYVQNNPVNNTDPSGNETLVSLSISMSIGVGFELLKASPTLWKGSKLITEGVAAGESLGAIGSQDATVDTATIIVHGMTGGHTNGWTKGNGFQGNLTAKPFGALSGNPLNHDFYEFNWGGFSIGERPWTGIPYKPVHQMGFVHLQMAQMLIWMKGYSDINIISHSWGTLLSYDLLNSGGIEMHHWVTMGSPLKKTTDKPVWVTGDWINCYSVFDPVSHFEIFPPLMSGIAMLPYVEVGWMRSIQGINGDGLAGNPNVTVGKNYNWPMGSSGIAEHGLYWLDKKVLSNLRNDLQ